MKKKVVAMMMAAVMACSLMACGSTNDAADTTANETEATDATDATEATDTAEATDATDAATDGKQYTIGISQFAEHGSLDNCREGFLQGLADAGIVEGENLTVIYDNAQADTGTASTIAENYVSQGVDMICGIATPSAMAAYNSCMNTDIPVIYTAVSDPVEAGLAKEDGTPAGNITGTSDALAINAQLEMIREMLPDAKTIGIIYTTSETNSVSTIASYKEAAPDYGFEIVETGIIDIALRDIHGNVRKLTDLKGKVVLLDFSVFQSPAGAPHNMLLRELYNKYASQGLEIYQISLDADEHYWKTAAANLPWICVRDGNGVYSTNVAVYNVRQVPSIFLINRNNELKLRGEDIKDLEASVKSLL